MIYFRFNYYYLLTY